MSFPFFKPQTGSKRFAAQPQKIYSEFPKNRRRILEKLCMETFLAVWYNKKVKTKNRFNVSGFSEKGEYYALYNDPGGQKRQP